MKRTVRVRVITENEWAFDLVDPLSNCTRLLQQVNSSHLRNSDVVFSMDIATCGEGNLANVIGGNRYPQ